MTQSESHDHERRTELEAYDFWNSQTTKQKHSAHWRGSPGWRPSKWRRYGRRWLHEVETFSKRHGHELRGRMLEWGPGGGCNVLAFSKYFDEIVGVDISVPTLEECSRRIKLYRPDFNFTSRHISIHDPEAIAGSGPFDFFLCVAVIQHMPSYEWVRRCLSAAAREVKNGHPALIQYRTLDNPSKENEAIEYERNVARWNIMKTSDVRTIATDSGWKILDIQGNPRRIQRGDSGFMYLYMQKNG